MRWLLIFALLAATSPVLENAHVRAYRSPDGSRTGVAHGPGVVIAIEDGPGVKAGSAVRVEDAAVPGAAAAPRGGVVIVQPLQAAHPVPPTAAGSKPGE